MKKAVSFLMSFIFCLCCVGCSNIGDQNSGDTLSAYASTSSNEQQSQTTALQNTSAQESSSSKQTIHTQTNNTQRKSTSNLPLKTVITRPNTTKLGLTTGSSQQSTKTSVTQNAATQFHHMFHKETEVFEWKCDIPPTQIKEYSGSPLEAFFITVNDELYEYNAQEIFAETGKHYRKIDTDMKMSYIYYHFQLNKLTVLTDDFKTYAYDKGKNKFTQMDDDFGGVVKEISKNNTIISWSAGNWDLAVVKFIDAKGDVYSVNQTDGTAYTQTLLCSAPKDEKILFANSAVIKTEKGYYCFDMEQSRFLFSEEPTAVYDNIAFLNDMIVMYKDDPTHIYDHELIYGFKFSYY